MYNQDSFFGLSKWGQIGLVCISTVLFIFMIFVTYKLLHRRTLWVRIIGALVLFWLFVWMSPQIYYTYYRTIIPDLPLQWVIWPPDSPLVAIRYLLFTGPQNLSAHSQGLLGWLLMAVTFLKLPKSR